MRLTFAGSVLNGKLRLDRREDFEASVRHFEGKRVTLELAKLTRKRSKEQNAWYWDAIAGLADHIGYDTAEELHEDLGHKFLLVHHASGLESRRSTTALTTVEFSDYMERVIHWAAEFHGYIIQDPTGGVRDERDIGV